MRRAFFTFVAAAALLLPGVADARPYVDGAEVCRSLSSLTSSPAGPVAVGTCPVVELILVEVPAVDSTAPTTHASCADVLDVR